MTRRWLAQQRVERLRRERDRRQTWLEAMERGWRQEKEEQLRDRRQRWKNPRRREDFNLLYHALESRLTFTPLILHLSDVVTGSASFDDDVFQSGGAKRSSGSTPRCRGPRGGRRSARYWSRRRSTSPPLDSIAAPPSATTGTRTSGSSWTRSEVTARPTPRVKPELNQITVTRLDPLCVE